MRRLTVNARDVVFALQGRSHGTVHYLDLETGDVIPVFAFNRERVLAAVRARPESYLRLAPRTSRRDYDVMAHFIETVDNDSLRECLRLAISGENAFSRFRTELNSFPAEQARWERYRAEAVTADLRAKLSCSGLELALGFD